MTSSAACARISAAAVGPRQARRQCEQLGAQRSATGKQRCSSSAAASLPPPSTSPRTPLLLSRRPSPSSSPVAARAFFDGSRSENNGGSDAAAAAAAAEDDDGGSNRALLAYSQAVTADDVEFFTRAAPADVVGAMTETVSGLLGSLACSAVANAARGAGGGGGASGGNSAAFPASAAAAVASSSLSSLSPSSAAAFEVRVRARDADLGQLLYSTLMTGYLMRNAASRLRLRSRLSAGGGGGGGGGGSGAAALAAVLPPPPLVLPPSPASEEEAPPPPLVKDDEDPTSLPPEARAAALASLEGTPRLAPGAQTSKVEGDVLKWDQRHGLVAVPAAAYIRALEAELASARSSAAAAAAVVASAASAASEEKGAVVALSSKNQLPPLPAPAASSPLSNPLLAFLRSADEASLASLTAEASPGVLEAANAFVQRIMTGGQESGSGGATSNNSPARGVYGAGGFGVAVGGGNGSGDSLVIREYRASELRHLLLFVMVVGFMLRTLEARLDIEFSMLLPRVGEGEENGEGEQGEEVGGG